MCIQIRKQAIKDLPMLCRDTPEHMPRISDVLTQLLQSEDQTELSLVQSSLVALLKANPKGTGTHTTSSSTFVLEFPMNDYNECVS